MKLNLALAKQLQSAQVITGLSIESKPLDGTYRLLIEVDNNGKFRYLQTQLNEVKVYRTLDHAFMDSQRIVGRIRFLHVIEPETPIDEIMEEIESRDPKLQNEIDNINYHLEQEDF
jgi:hypothetical protein